MKKRRKHNGAFKVKVALEMLKEEKTAVQVASENGIHVTMAHAWRRELLEKAPDMLEDKRKNTSSAEQEKLIEHLYKQIGQQKVEIDFLEGACAKLNLKPGKGV